MKKSERAAAAMKSQTTNCAQSVIDVFVDDTGIERDTALKLSLGFGGGLGHTGGVCGAVSAACMVLGLRQDFDPNNPKKNRDRLYALEQEFLRRFRAEFGSVNCTELLGHDLSTAGGAAAVKEKGLTALLCLRLVAAAVDILEEMAHTK
ncbi:MAG TPA: C-GCAxxG-C-C family protein [Dehalococcoidales bacterium]|nr:C-GCAxxG-C-C family protein [Dehalococcoidales bacterium]